MKFTLLQIIFLIAFIILTILFIGFFNKVAKYFFKSTNNSNPRGELLKLTFQVIGGIILLFGAWHTYRTSSAMYENNKLVERGNTAQRFNDAINMLESEKENTCLGGIYALNQIAKDNQEYKEQVFNVLTTYINTKTKDLPLWKDIPIPKRFETKPSIEIQTIIKLLFSKKEPLYKSYTCTFENAKLYGADFSDLNFSKTHFKNVEFQNSTFINTWFILCDVINTDFTYSQFQYAIWSGSNFWGGVTFGCCQIFSTLFNGCSIQLTEFAFSKIFADFDGANINQCSFDGCKFDYYESSFRGTIINVSADGALCKKEIIGRGCLSDNGSSLNLDSLMKKQIGKEGKYTFRNFYNEPHIEDEIPKDKLLKFEGLIDTSTINSNKWYCHTIFEIKNKDFKGTGLKFKDLSKLTIKDTTEIISSYKKAIKLAD